MDQAQLRQEWCKEDRSLLVDDQEGGSGKALTQTTCVFIFYDPKIRVIIILIMLILYHLVIVTGNQQYQVLSLCLYSLPSFPTDH